MKLAVSSIAWTNEEEPAVAELLRSLGVKYVEIAPTKKWDEPIEATNEEIEAYKTWWRQYDIEIVAFQSMLFAHPDYKLFESQENRQQTLKYLKDFIGLAGKTGALRMVFGSPKNRQKGELSTIDADLIATRFFSELADKAEAEGVIFCVEPNAPQYNCDYVTTASDGLELVKTINKPGFGLHLDTACMALAGDDIPLSIQNAAEYLKHFHVSAPMLGVVDYTTEIDHTAAAKALRNINYDGFVSIEMRPGDIDTNVNRVRTAVEFVQNIYK